MLDFLVLGIVPGTNFVITVRWALVFGLVFMLILLAYVELSKPTQTVIEEVSEIEIEDSVSLDTTPELA